MRNGPATKSDFITRAEPFGSSHLAPVRVDCGPKRVLRDSLPLVIRTYRESPAPMPRNSRDEREQREICPLSTWGGLVAPGSGRTVARLGAALAAALTFHNAGG